MKGNKKLSIAKAKSVLHQKIKKEIMIPQDAPESLNLFLNEESKKTKKEKTIKINTEIKSIVDKYLKDFANNFDNEYKNYYTKEENLYRIKYKIISYTNEFLKLKCSEKNCKINTKLYYLNNNDFGFPDPDGNIIALNKLCKRLYKYELS